MDARAAASRGSVRVGISGWEYASWRGDFYPEGLRHRDELSYAAERLDSIELNGSFYSLQRPERYRRWRDAVPEGFVFAVKGGRFITHMLRLHEPRQALANFFASGVLGLGDRLGPVLWQLPSTLPFDPGRLEAFCEALPTSTAAAARLARGHDERLDGRALTRTDADRPILHALEARDLSYGHDDCLDVLRRHGIALIASDGAGRWPLLRELTADAAYVRLHGHTELYSSGYSPGSLRRWADEIEGWRSGSSATDGRARDVYVYFDNDARGRAPHDALALRGLLEEDARR